VVLLPIPVAVPAVSLVTLVTDFEFPFALFFEVSGARRPDGAGVCPSGQTMGDTYRATHVP
jgi:hypothetical protein